MRVGLSWGGVTGAVVAWVGQVRSVRVNTSPASSTRTFFLGYGNCDEGPLERSACEGRGSLPTVPRGQERGFC